MIRIRHWTSRQSQDAQVRSSPDMSEFETRAECLAHAAGLAAMLDEMVRRHAEAVASLLRETAQAGCAALGTEPKDKWEKLVRQLDYAQARRDYEDMLNRWVQASTQLKLQMTAMEHELRKVEKSKP